MKFYTYMNDRNIYIIGKIDFCCEKMMKNILMFKKIGTENVSIFIKIYKDGRLFINFCPFCGMEITEEGYEVP